MTEDRLEVGPISCPFMFWPLIGGFIAFFLLTVLIGWIMDSSRHGDAGEREGH